MHIFGIGIVKETGDELSRLTFEHPFYFKAFGFSHLYIGILSYQTLSEEAGEVGHILYAHTYLIH